MRQAVCLSIAKDAQITRGSADVTLIRGEPAMTVITDNPEDVITEVSRGVLTITQKPSVIVGTGSGPVIFCDDRSGS